MKEAFRMLIKRFEDEGRTCGQPGLSERSAASVKPAESTDSVAGTVGSSRGVG